MVTGKIAQELNYIRNIGAWSDPKHRETVGGIAHLNQVHKLNIITPRTVQLLRTYIEWAPKRKWDFGHWELFYNYATARLEEVEKRLAREAAKNKKNNPEF
jgi:ABC-type transport system involved in cytochrome c biogenesis permease subunit